MNIFKYSFLLVTILSFGSLTPSQRPLLEDLAPQFTLPVFNNKPKAAVAVSGTLIFYPKRHRTYLTLLDKDNQVLYSAMYSGKKTLKAIKEACPTCIDTTHLTSILDFSGQGDWFLLFGKNIYILPINIKDFYEYIQI